MNRINKTFQELKRSKKKALSIFLTAGFPELRSIETLVPELAGCGVDLFEIGFPFSDPIADGPTIQKSSEDAIKNGMTWNKLLEQVKNIRKKTQVPLVLMTYSNALYCRGWETSVREMKAAGFDGAILPDIIPEEGAEIEKVFRRSGLDLIYLLAPTSTKERIGMVSKRASGFIYCVSVTGVTGARTELPFTEIAAFLKLVRSQSKSPVMLGFGISKPEHIEKLKGSTDGFIVASALINLMRKHEKQPSLLKKIKEFVLLLDKARYHYGKRDKRKNQNSLEQMSVLRPDHL